MPLSLSPSTTQIPTHQGTPSRKSIPYRLWSSTRRKTLPPRQGPSANIQSRHRGPEFVGNNEILKFKLTSPIMGGDGRCADKLSSTSSGQKLGRDSTSGSWYLYGRHMYAKYLAEPRTPTYIISLAWRLRLVR